jgi:hypothetical protein
MGPIGGNFALWAVQGAIDKRLIAADKKEDTRAGGGPPFSMLHRSKTPAGGEKSGFWEREIQVIGR